jgi:predicted amidohydrolase
MRLITLQPTLGTDGDGRNNAVISGIVDEIRATVRPALEKDDILLLPEHFTFSDDPAAYDRFVAGLASRSGCTVVGGSHHRPREGKRVNFGSAIGPDGDVIGTYEKLRPYFNEQRHVVPGRAFGEFAIGGWNVVVLICADFWYSDLLLSATTVPDLVLVPALSVSRKEDPEYSRALWRDLAVIRAYEFGAYVGISDWSADSTLPKYRTCGVAGLADPTSTDPGSFFTPVAGASWTVHGLDFEKIEAFREDRRMRGFFWK